MQADIYSALDFGVDKVAGRGRKGESMNYANPHLLWSVDELRDHLQDPNLVLLDMRPPEVYSNGHIPGARSFDIFGISLIDTRPEPLEAFLWMIEHLIQGKGVNTGSNVVVYDDIAGMRAARLFWFLEFFGHDAVHMLNGGFNAWRDAVFPSRSRRSFPRPAISRCKHGVSGLQPSRTSCRNCIGPPPSSWTHEAMQNIPVKLCEPSEGVRSRGQFIWNGQTILTRRDSSNPPLSCLEFMPKAKSRRTKKSFPIARGRTGRPTRIWHCVCSVTLRCGIILAPGASGAIVKIYQSNIHRNP